MSLLEKYKINQNFIPGLPQIPFRNGVGQYEGVVMHATANWNDTANGERTYETGHFESAFVHTFTDETQILQVADFNYVAWHACKTANARYLGNELCQSRDYNEFLIAYDQWIWLAAYQLYQRKLGVIDGETLLSHHQCTDKWHESTHTDPDEYLAYHKKVWADVVKDVTTYYNQFVSEESGMKTMDNPTVIKERIYAENGVLKYAYRNTGSPDYTVSATDVRYIKFKKDSYKLKLVWAKGKTVSQLVKENGADYGFNFPYFYDGDPVADCKIGSQVLSQGYDDPKNNVKMTSWHGFAYKNGQPSIGYFDIKDDYGADGFLVKTTPLLIDNGNPCWDWFQKNECTATDIGRDSNGNLVRAQRTMIGLDKEGNLHLAVGDGRTQFDRGLTLEEMALYMASKNVINSISGDGGSSSVIADQTGSLGQNKGTAERAVNHAVLVFLNKPDELQPLRDKAKAVKNQVDYMSTLIDGSGNGTEKWALSNLSQTYDIMKSQGLLK